MTNGINREATHVIYHKVLTRAFAHDEIKAIYDRMCVGGTPIDDALKLFDVNYSSDTAIDADFHYSKQLLRTSVKYAVLQYLSEATKTGIIICGTAVETADIAMKEHGEDYKKSLLDTILVSMTKECQNIRRYLRIILRSVFERDLKNVVRSPNIRRSEFTVVYTGQEFAQLDKASCGKVNDYLFTRAIKTANGKTIPPRKTHVAYEIDPPKTSEGYVFDGEPTIEQIWNSRTSVAKLYIEAIDNGLRRIDPDNPAAQIIWENDNGLLIPRRYQTIGQIIRRARKLDRKKSIKPEVEAAALSLLERLACIRAEIDYNDIVPTEGCTRNAVRDYLISFKYRNVVMNGKEEKVLVFNSVSVFGQLAQRLQEATGRARVLNLPNAYLYNPHVQNTDRNAVLYRYLAEWVWSKGMKNTRYYSTFYDLLDGEKNPHQEKKRRTRKDVEKALDYYLTLSDCPFTAWRYWTGIDGDGVEIIRQKNTKQLEADVKDVKKRLETVEEKTADFD